MAKKSSPVLLLTFEDDSTVEIHTRPKDVARAEINGHDFANSGPILALYATALACLGRLERSGVLPEGVTVPATLEEFVDACDVEPLEPEGDDAEGEDMGQGPSSG